MQKEMARILKLSGFLTWCSLSQLHSPLAIVIVPVSSNDFCIEDHVLPKIKGVTDFVQVFPDIWRVGKESRPVRVQRKLIGIRVRWNITRAAGIPILLSVDL